MTKVQMVEFIVDMYNKYSERKINNAQKKHIVSAATNANSKEIIQNYYWKTGNMERLHYDNSTIRTLCIDYIWELTYIHLCPGD